MDGSHSRRMTTRLKADNDCRARYAVAACPKRLGATDIPSNANHWASRGMRMADRGAGAARRGRPDAINESQSLPTSVFQGLLTAAAQCDCCGPHCQKAVCVKPPLVH